ncbi:DeoR/GlpR family DNA-binding transcription regulator [Amycolatopsis silviterrae]|uniref:DeoR/GlpR family DNA-binding transcription regulator n=1 Tax=Amycolatopsis silviterrae TaxID=1656914 RepID=A0ABW5H301_9PSEU
MTPQQRLNALLELVSERGNVTISEIGSALDVSPATARRDLTILVDQRLITRTHGGAAALGTGYELPLQYKIARQAEAKTAIAARAADLVQPGETVGINGGTTTTEVARALGKSERFIRADGEAGLTVVTNALNIAYELSVRAHVKIVVTGGVARRQSYELVGSLVSDALSAFALDTVILGVDGLSAQYGATTLHEGEADVSRHFSQVARRVIVVADGTKLTKATFARICRLDAIDALVTDADVPASFAADLAAASVELVVAR